MNINYLRSQFIQWEHKISSDEVAKEVEGDIKCLNSLEEIKEYYLYRRGWTTDENRLCDLLSFIVTLFNPIITNITTRDKDDEDEYKKMSDSMKEIFNTKPK